MSRVKNILFVMYDQLRADYLSCFGHPAIRTPAIDALARRGVRFSRAYCQSPVCGPSRMSFYTGRYPSSHGTTWNNIPMEASERTIGDYLSTLGRRVAVVGVTHFIPDRTGLKRLGVPLDTDAGRLLAEGGFEPFENDFQIHPDQSPNLDFPYNQYLRRHGYDGPNPWHFHANAALGPDGEILSGWFMRHAHLPSRVAEEHSETAYFTNRAKEFIVDAGSQPWFLHLSYMKPHWPYMAPAPYHNMYAQADVLPANRTTREAEDAHPVIRAFMQHDEAESFREESRRRHVIPTYMGLISQADAHFANLIAFMEQRGLMDNTMIVVTSDHGSYLGDHWLGEKILFHEESVRIPMIVYDPSPEADATRGTVVDRLVEAIDLVPTFVDTLGGTPDFARLEGRSLRPLICGREIPWRRAVFSEQDYSFQRARKILGLSPSEARAYMVRTDDWKYILYENFRPQLFDLKNDPQEQTDLGASPAHEDVRHTLHEELFAWFRRRKVRKNVTDDEVERSTDTARQRGVFIEIW